MAYEEVFGFAPCGTCQGVDWKQKYNSVVKQYAKLNNIQITMSNAKFIWNPKKEKVFTFVNGRVVNSDCKDQSILEKLFNDPKKDVVILNPNYKVEGKSKEVKTVDTKAIDPVKTESDKDLVNRLSSEGKTIDEIKEQTGISKTKIKDYLKKVE